MMKRLSVLVFWMFFLISSAYAATIQGTVYDVALKPMEGVLVEVNSIPVQKMIVQKGEYTFTVPPGAYDLVVKGGKGLSEVLEKEHVDIKNEGTFTIDLIVFPSVDEASVGEETSPNQELAGLLDSGKTGSVAALIVVLLGVLGGVIFFVARGKKKIEEPVQPMQPTVEEGGLNQILAILKEEQGRMTQKDLRKRMPLSEAKLSLMLTELEAKGKIEKIKKGRGNVLILK